MRGRGGLWLGWAIILLLAEVLVEEWICELTGSSAPKLVKNGLLVLLIGLTAWRIHRDKRWRDFRSPADLALLFLLATLLASSFAGDVPFVVSGQASYVYLRGAIVFYAIRALRPSPAWTRGIYWMIGAWVVLNAAMALVQIVGGPSSHAAIGWADLSTAQIHRAQGFFPHPNDLGHVLGLAMLAIFAWLTADSRPRVWLLFAIVGAGLAAAQSRESLMGVACGFAVIAIWRRLSLSKVVTALSVMLLLAAVPILTLDSVRNEMARRIWGVADGLGWQTGPRPQFVDPSVPVCGPPDEDEIQTGRPGSRCRREGRQIEIRVLYAQQGIALWHSRPVLGYGAGTFGGVVALENDPNWNKHPRFGPQGFDLHGFHGKTVDSFWLHLLVEAGALGMLAYLVWLASLCLPLWRAGRDAPPIVGVALAGVVFGVVIAFLSPSLESPLVPPLLFAVLGLAWSSRDHGIVTK